MKKNKIKTMMEPQTREKKESIGLLGSLKADSILPFLSIHFPMLNGPSYSIFVLPNKLQTQLGI
jgi:hypothetical protein